MFVFLFLVFGLAGADEVRVTTSRGVVIGQTTSDGYSTFFGVPYAKVDEVNPFGNSLEHPPFIEPFRASNNSVRCPQAARFEGGVLQCLTLHIYVPDGASLTNKKAVFVWFYGGGFMSGAADIYGGKYLVQRDIIVVTVNYRLGPYGFFCLKTPNVPGNQGLKDQITALRWIKANIGAFGGDASKVTIAGESYGGGAVDFHLYSLYEQLFDKAIIQSGSIYTPYIFRKGDHHAAKELAQKLGYMSSGTKDALRFLASANPIDVMKMSSNLSSPLLPCKERKYDGVENFMTTDPYHFTQSDKVKKITLLIGMNSKETFNIFAEADDKFYKDLKHDFREKLGEIFDLSKDKLNTLAKIVQDFYLGGKPIGKETMLEMCDFWSDFLGNHAGERSVNKYLELGGHRVYKYMFSYVGGSPYKHIPGVGAIHTEELQYLFEMTENLTTPEQIMMRDRMTEMWANFVKYGNPVPKVSSLLPVKWKPVKKDNARPYMNIDVEMSLEDHVYHERMAFWDLIWHRYWKNFVALY